jgi:hypothetical protein
VRPPAPVPGYRPAASRLTPRRARSSVGERSLHTREVAGSKPAAPIFRPECAPPPSRARLSYRGRNLRPLQPQQESERLAPRPGGGGNLDGGFDLRLRRSLLLLAPSACCRRRRVKPVLVVSKNGRGRLGEAVVHWYIVNGSETGTGGKPVLRPRWLTAGTLPSARIIGRSVGGRLLLGGRRLELRRRGLAGRLRLRRGGGSGRAPSDRLARRTVAGLAGQ